MLGVAFWIARQDRPIGKKHFDKLVKKDELLTEQVETLEREQRVHSRKQGELAGAGQRQQTDRIDELAQKLQELEAEIAALKRPAT